MTQIIQQLPGKQQGIVYTTVITSWQEVLPPLLDSAGLLEGIDSKRPILIKPNLVEPQNPPITTHVGLIEVLIDYLQEHLPEQRLIIGEGTGSLSRDTYHCFDVLGYTRLAQDRGLELIDLNVEELTHKQDSDCNRWPEMYLPKLLDEVFLLSVPILKAHTLAKVTLTMKNMMGCAPPAHYNGGGPWGKASFHTRMHESIFDLNRYRTPDFTLLDATIGMSQSHLWGPSCDPPINRLAASWDPVAIDSYGAALLGKDWRTVEHIRLADGLLGQAEIARPLEVTYEEPQMTQRTGTNSNSLSETEP